MQAKRPIVVLVDLSRDGLTPDHWVRLHRDPRFHVVENERRLTARLLGQCDVLVIHGRGGTRYTKAELRAVRDFVKAGGGLVLSVDADGFDRGVGRSGATSAGQAVADLFEIRFLSPDEARGRTRRTEWLECGYRRRDLALSAGGPLAGFRLDDLRIRRCLPLDVPKAARVLLRHRRTHEPVAATVRFGEGRVLAAGMKEFGRPWPTVGRAVVTWLAGSRRPGSALPPGRREAAWADLRRGPLRVRYRNVTRDRVNEVATTFARLTDWFAGLFRRRKPVERRVDIVPGVGVRRRWAWQTQRSAYTIGADTCEASLVYDLAFGLAADFLGYDGIGHVLSHAIGAENLHQHLALRALAALGFEAESTRRRGVLESWPEGDRDPRSVDLGRWYSEIGPSPAIWMWPALEEAFGPAVIDRFLRDQPRSFPWKKFPFTDVHTNFDFVAYYLSMAAGRDLSGWFAERGHTVHPIPLVPTKDKRFTDRCLAPIRRQFRDAGQPISERFDAARALVRARVHKRVSLAKEARRLTAADESDRLLAGMRLARARDPRGRAALRRLALTSKDDALAAIAAVTLAEAGETAIADRLADLAAGADARFQHDAATALRRLGRPADAPLRVRAARERGELLLLGMVDGYGAANVFSGVSAEFWPQGVVVPQFFINWVHTAPKWRRKGISRRLFLRAMRDRWCREAPVAALWTGTTNTAHALYRSAGFVDLRVYESCSRSLRSLPDRPRVKGLRIRAARPGDAQAIRDLTNAVFKDDLWFHQVREERLDGRALVFVAERDGAVIGFVKAVQRGPNRKGEVAIHLIDVCAKRDKDARHVIHGLAARLCAVGKRRGARRVQAYDLPDGDEVKRGLEAAGFAFEKDGGVSMWRLNDLPLLLTHIRPLLEHRLRDKKRRDWSGAIAIRGERHRAGLRIAAGRVRVLKRPPARPDIAIDAGDDTIARLLCGRQTVFEAMLQTDLRLSPKANRDVTTLLEALFPRMRVY